MTSLDRAHLHHLAARSPAPLRQAVGKRVCAEHAQVVDGLPEDRFEDMIDRGLLLGRDRFQRGRSVDLAKVVLLKFDRGPAFHRHPSVDAALSSAVIPPDDPFTKPWARVSDGDWAKDRGVPPRT